MAYLKFHVKTDARALREHIPESDSIALASIKIGGASGVEINSSNLVTADNSQTFTNKTIDGLSNTLTNIQGSSLSNNAKETVLQYRKLAVWDQVNSLSATGSSKNVTEAVENAAATDVATTNNNVKGILTTGTGAGGAGTQNYAVQLRLSSNGDPVDDGSTGQAYGELTHANAVVATGDISTSLASPTVTGASTTFLTDFAVGDGLYSSAGAFVGYVLTVDSDTQITLTANAAVALTNDTNYIRHRFTLSFKKRDGSTFTFGGATNVDFLFAEIYDYDDRPWRADLYGTGFVDVLTMPQTHTHSAADITSGTLDNSRFNAYSNLVAYSAIGAGSQQVAAGNHAHAFSEITGTLANSQFDAYADLVADSKIGTGSDQVAAGNHAHAFSEITGTLANSQFDAYADLVADSKIGTGSDQVAAGNHAHAFSEITGTLANSQFDAYADLVADSKIGTGSDQVAAGNHTHATLMPRQLTAGEAIGAAGKVCYVAADGKAYLADNSQSEVHIHRLLVADAAIGSGAVGGFYYLPGTRVPSLSGLTSVIVSKEIYLGSSGDVTQNLAGITGGKVREFLGYGMDASGWELMQPQYLEHSV